jgi:hypothetical protein
MIRFKKNDRFKSKMKPRFLGFVFLFSANFVKATNYYVDFSVSRSGNGLSWSSAGKTMAEGPLLNLLAGDAVFIKNGTYAEGFSYAT